MRLNSYVAAQSDDVRRSAEVGELVAEDRYGRWSALPALALILAVAAAIVLWLGRGITLIGDQWAWILSALDASPGQIFQDYNGHLMATTYMLYDIVPRVGLGQFWAYRIVALVLHLTVALLVFCLARTRLGPWLALAPAGIVAFLGTGADAFLSGLNYNLLSATAASLAALLAVDRRTRRGDLAACALLTLGLASFTLTVAYTAGVAVELLWQRARHRLWVPVAPAALYGVWRLHWGSAAETGRQGAWAVLHHSFEAATGAFAGLAGVQLANFSLKGHFPWLSPLAQVMLAVAVVVFAWIAARRRPLSPRLANLTAAAVVLWLLIGLGRGSQEDPYSSRYVYQGAILAALILVELVSPYKVARSLTRIVVAAIPAAVVLNILWLGVYAHHLRRESAVTRAQLTALEIARGSVGPEFQPAQGFALGHVTAGKYFDAVRRFGDSPAYSLAQLRHAAENAREAADGVLIRAFHMRLVSRRASGGPAPRMEQVRAGRVLRRGSCFELTPTSASAITEITLPEGSGFVLEKSARAKVRVQVRRFARRYIDLLGQPRNATFIGVDAPSGHAPDRWHLRLVATATTRVCTAPPAA